MVYPCYVCQRGITLPYVDYATIVSPGVLRVVYRCACNVQARPLSRCFEWNDEATEALFKPFSVALPYRAAGALPFSDDVRTEDASYIRRMAWELEQLESADEFLLLTSWPPAPAER